MEDLVFTVYVSQHMLCMALVRLLFLQVQEMNRATETLLVHYSIKVQVYQVRSLDRPLFIVFVQNSEGIIITSQTREQGMMEGTVVSSSLFSVFTVKKRVH